jgi:hypothetical protein
MTHQAEKTFAPGALFSSLAFTLSTPPGHECLGRISRGMKVNEKISRVPRRGKKAIAI